MARTSQRKAYYPALDSLRLFAMLGILIYHYAPHQLPGGFIGVDTFLIISGFLLSRSILNRKHPDFRTYYAQYVAKRILRLAVPIVAMILLSVSIINVFFGELLYNVRGTLLSSVLFVNNWWQIAQGASYFEAYVHPSAFTHLWYVAVLMQLCLVWPVLLLFMNRFLPNRRRIALALLGMAVVSAVLMGVLYRAGADPSRVYYGTDTRLYAFALGSALGVVWQPHRFQEQFGKRAPLMVDGGIVVVSMLLLFFSLHLFDQSIWTYRGGMFLAALFSTVLVALLTIPVGCVQRLLSLNGLVFIGKCTYSMYLWYYPVMMMGNQTVLLSKFKFLQWVILIGLSITTYLLVEEGLVKRLMKGDLPTRESVKGYMDSLHSNRQRLIAALMVGVLAISSCIGLIRADSGENQTVAEMEAQIAENQRILAEKEAIKERKAQAEIEDLPWLDRSVMLYARKLNVTFVGDSILLAAAKPLSDAFPSATIDGKVGRQLNQSVDVVKALRENKKLADVVVVVLGSNGPFTDEQFKTFMEELKDKRVFLVNTSEPRAWQDDVNKKLKAWADKSKKDKVTLIDWKTLIDKHPEWLYEDATHTNPEGAEGFATLIANTLYDELASAEQKEKDKIATKKMKEEAASNGDTAPAEAPKAATADANKDTTASSSKENKNSTNKTDKKA